MLIQVVLVEMVQEHLSQALMLIKLAAVQQEDHQQMVVLELVVLLLEVMEHLIKVVVDQVVQLQVVEV